MFHETFRKLHKWLSGEPTEYLRAALILTAVVGIVIALYAPPELIAITLAYWWLP